jgi:hypothetical protein
MASEPMDLALADEEAFTGSGNGRLQPYLTFSAERSRALALFALE